MREAAYRVEGKWRTKREVLDKTTGELIARRGNLPPRSCCAGVFEGGHGSVDVFQTRRDDDKFIGLVAEHRNESDIIEALKTLVDIKNGIGMVDDIDHLGIDEFAASVKWRRTSSVSAW